MLPRNIKDNNTSMNFNALSDVTNFKRILNAIHSGAIYTLIDSLLVNGVLGVKTPSITSRELELPQSE